MSFQTCKPKFEECGFVFCKCNVGAVLCILKMLTLQLCNCKFVNQDL